MVPIVAVDDSTEDLFLAERVLRQAKILNPVLSLKSGQECITYFERDDPAAQPTLLFLDLLMFPTSGLAVLRRLRQNQRFKNSIIVVLTGLGDVRGISEAYQAGATTFLIKPLKLDELIRFLASFSKHFVFRERPGGYCLHWAEVAPRLGPALTEEVSR